MGIDSNFACFKYVCIFVADTSAFMLRLFDCLAISSTEITVHLVKLAKEF